MNDQVFTLNHSVMHRNNFFKCANTTAFIWFVIIKDSIAITVAQG